MGKAANLRWSAGKSRDDVCKLFNEFIIIGGAVGGEPENLLVDLEVLQAFRNARCKVDASVSLRCPMSLHQRRVPQLKIQINRRTL